MCATVIWLAVLAAGGPGAIPGPFGGIVDNRPPNMVDVVRTDGPTGVLMTSDGRRFRVPHGSAGGPPMPYFNHPCTNLRTRGSVGLVLIASDSPEGAGPVIQLWQGLWEGRWHEMRSWDPRQESVPKWVPIWRGSAAKLSPGDPREP